MGLFTKDQTAHANVVYKDVQKYLAQKDGKTHVVMVNNSDYLQKARKYGHFTGYKN